MINLNSNISFSYKLNQNQLNQDKSPCFVSKNLIQDTYSFKTNIIKNKLSFGSSFGVKVCGTCDKPSVLAALSAAKEAKSDKLIIGCLVALTHNATEKLTDDAIADVVKYTRQTSYSMNQPVKIACVNHCITSDDLIFHINAIEEKVFEGEDGLIAQAKKAHSNEKLGNPDTSSLTKRPVFEIIQIHDNMPLTEIKKVKEAYPESKIIKAVHVPKKGEDYNLEEIKENAVNLAKQPYIDGLLLDTANLATNQIGGTGLLNDWDVAREVIDIIHEKTGKPVAMAGGLSADNAREAIETTHADMVDANSGWRFDKNKSAWAKLNPNDTAPKNVFAIYSVLKQFENHVSKFFENKLGN